MQLCSNARRAFLIITSAIAVALASSASSARPLDEVVDSKILRVIAYSDNKPFSWEDDAGPKGIEVDLAKAIARELGVKAEIVLRMQGEKGDDDIRANVWRGPLTGGGVGDLMLHVPIDREFSLRNPEAVFGNSYFQERVSVAIHPELTGENPTFEVFKEKKIGVQLGSVSDYFLMTYQDGALIETISHHVKPDAGIKEFLSRETTAIMGIRSVLEALLNEKGTKAQFVEPDMSGIVRTQWLVGMAWKENSRDLGYAAEAALTKIRESGELTKICASYGVTYTPPPPPP